MKIYQVLLKSLLCLIFSVFILSSCDTDTRLSNDDLAKDRLSNDDLAKEVVASMEEWFADNGPESPDSLILTASVDSLILARESNDSNIYWGILETTECVGPTVCWEYTYSVKVIYDGENITWEIE